MTKLLTQKVLICYEYNRHNIIFFVTTLLTLKLIRNRYKVLITHIVISSNHHIVISSNHYFVSNYFLKHLVPMEFRHIQRKNYCHKNITLVYLFLSQIVFLNE